MLDFEIFSIYTTSDKMDGCDGRDRELFSSFNDAMTARTKYANWLCEKGDVYIRRFVDGMMRAKETWHVCVDGTVDFHY